MILRKLLSRICLFLYHLQFKTVYVLYSRIKSLSCGSHSVRKRRLKPVILDLAKESTPTVVLLSPPMSSISFPEPPTQATLADARRALNETRATVHDLTSKIDQAEVALAQIVHDSKTVINQMQDERTRLEEQLLHTMAYLSPIRRLPSDLLGDIFTCSFEEYSCQAWILASVCSSWRRLALRMPRIWSKARCCPFFSITPVVRYSSWNPPTNVLLCQQD